MKGIWTSRSNGFYYTGLSSYQLDKLLQKCKRRGQGKKKEWFIPADRLTAEAKKELILAEDTNDEILEQLESNVDFTQNVQYLDQTQNINLDLKKARKEKVLSETKLINQRLNQRRREQFADWSQNFFSVFSDSFGKLKNCLVSMHLSQEQINVFNETLDSCLNNLQLNLDRIWNEYNKEEQTNEEED